MWFKNGLKIIQNMTDKMLNQCAYLFQAVEGHINLIFWSKYITPNQKDCLIIAKTLKKQEFFYLDLQEY